MAAQRVDLCRLLYWVFILTRTENNIVEPEKPLFYRCFVDDIINRKEKEKQA